MNPPNDAFLKKIDDFLSDDMGPINEPVPGPDMGYSQHQANERLHEAIESQRASIEGQEQRLMRALELVRQAAEKRPKRIRAPSGKVYEIED